MQNAMEGEVTASSKILLQCGNCRLAFRARRDGQVPCTANETRKDVIIRQTYI